MTGARPGFFGVAALVGILLTPGCLSVTPAQADQARMAQHMECMKASGRMGDATASPASPGSPAMKCPMMGGNVASGEAERAEHAHGDDGAPAPKAEQHE